MTTLATCVARGLSPATPRSRVVAATTALDLPV